MAFEKVDDLSFVNAAIKREVRMTIEKVVKVELEAEIQEALERAQNRVKQEIDQIALRVLSHYDISRHGPNIVITVRKEF